MRAQARVTGTAVAGAAALRLAHHDGARLQVEQNDALDDNETRSFFRSDVEVVLVVAGVDRDDLETVASESGKDRRYPVLRERNGFGLPEKLLGKVADLAGDRALNAKGASVAQDFVEHLHLLQLEQVVRLEGHPADQSVGRRHELLALRVAQVGRDRDEAFPQRQDFDLVRVSPGFIQTPVSPGSPVKLQLVGGELSDGVKVDAGVALDPDVSRSAVEDDPASRLLLLVLKIFLQVAEDVVDEADPEIHVPGFQLK